MKRFYFILFLCGLLNANQLENTFSPSNAPQTNASQKPLEPSIDFNPPEYVENMPEKEFIPEFSKPGSLFGQGDRPLFSDRRAMKPDDLITVVIDESSEASFNTNKAYSGSSGGNITPPVIDYNGTDENQKQAAEYLNNQTGFSLQKGKNNSNFQGGGNQSRNQSTKLVLTARIIKVLENGNYFIYGDKEILVDGEKQIMRLSGVIRPYDISRDNTIASKYIANARIEYKSAGDISDTTRQKPKTKAIENDWPF